LGINFFDTANYYSLGKSEEILGEFLQGMRDDAVVATKVFFPMSEKPNDRGLSRKHIMKQINDSLRRLKTDYVDLYQIHR
jgi:aryl-alcohol dehydrogenase (NADP+)